MTTVSTPASSRSQRIPHADVHHRLCQSEVGAVASIAGVPPEEADAAGGDVLGEVVLGEVHLVVGGDQRDLRPHSVLVVVEALARPPTGTRPGNGGRLGRDELTLDAG